MLLTVWLTLASVGRDMGLAACTNLMLPSSMTEGTRLMEICVEHLLSRVLISANVGLPKPWDMRRWGV